MRLVLVVFALLAGTGPMIAAQQGQTAPDLYRGPLYMSRDAAFVEPQSGAPFEFTSSTLNFGYVLTTFARSKTVYSVDAARMTLRVAFGPTADGMITFRMKFRADAQNAVVRIIPDQRSVLLQFSIDPADRQPGPLALRPGMNVVFTLERVERDGGALLYENPDATELLWEALGRPTPSRQ